MPLRILVLVVGVVVAAVLLAALGWGLLHPANQVAGTLVGRSAPPLTITTLDGRELDLANLRGTPSVINFWASWCVPCKEEAPVLNAAARAYGG